MGQAPVRKKKKGCGPVLLAIIIILAVLVGAGGWYTMGLRAVEPGSEAACRPTHTFSTRECHSSRS